MSFSIPHIFSLLKVNDTALNLESEIIKKRRKQKKEIGKQ
jgi:hypothetical protein